MLIHTNLRTKVYTVSAMTLEKKETAVNYQRKDYSKHNFKQILEDMQGLDETEDNGGKPTFAEGLLTAGHCSTYHLI